MNKHSVAIFVTFIFLFLTNISLAKDFSYPELLVKPSASDRLLMEAKRERKSRAYEPIPMQISAASTFVAGILQYSNTNEIDDPDKYAALTGTLVGATWLTLNFIQFNRKKAYYNGYRSVKSMSAKNKEEQLARERIAEEILMERAKLAKKFAYISAATNFGASVYMMSAAESKSTSKIVNAFSMLASFIPIIFHIREREVYEIHKSYKKKIYAPLVNLDLFHNKVTNEYHPGMKLSFNF